MVYFAIVFMTVLVTTGMVVEGGRLYVTYRQMQKAADVAALVGAQKLPGSPSTAAANACTYAASNGFGSGTCDTNSPPSAPVSGNSAVTACVPPASKTPYDTTIASYGGSTAGCSAPTTSQYIEVQIAYNIGTIPIFNVPITMYAHAIARNGIPDVTDYAIVAMNSTNSISGGALTISGNQSIVVVGSAFINSTDPNSFNTPSGSGDQESMCNGQWLNSSAESMPGKLFNYTGAVIEPAFSPPGCGGATSPAVSGTDYLNNAGKISDPYGDSDCPNANPASETGTIGYQSCSTSTAATSNTNLSNTCTSNYCVKTAWYLDRKNNKWLQAPSTGVSASGTDVLELFPGVYPGGICIVGGQVYMNPGVYIMGGTCSGSTAFKDNGGTVCVFGAPACDVANSSWNYLTTQFANANKGVIPYPLSSTAWTTGNCGSAVFTPTSDPAYVPPRTWNYYCSPWGYWDPNVANENVTCSVSPDCSLPTGHPTYLTTPPVFLNQDGTASTTPLNGVTIYLETGDVNIQGNAGMNLAMPNPCYGNGTGTQGTVPSGQTTPPVNPGGVADFPSGDTPLRYTYPSSSLGPLTGVSGTGLAGTTSPLTADIYPSGDLESKCQDSSGNTLNMQVWNHEFSTTNFPTGQHLHFFIFSKTSPSAISLAGGGSQNFWGIVHTWPFQSTGSFPGPPSSTEGYAGDSVTLTGNSGGSGGPAFLFGQVIGDNLKFSGSSLVEVFNRPGGRSSAPGVGLIQ